MNRLQFGAIVMIAFLLSFAVACTSASTPTPTSAPAPTKAEAAPTKAAAAPTKAAAAAATQAAAPAKAKSLPSVIGLGANPAGSSFNSVGQGLAKVASDRSPIKVMLKAYAGPTAWMPLMEKGELELGLVPATDAGWAYESGATFPTRNKNFRLLLRGNQMEVAGMAVRNDSDIKSVKDVRGKRVTSEFTGARAVHEVLTAYLESVGLTWNDVKPVPVTDSPLAIRALRDGRADVAFGFSSTTPASLEADAAIGLRALSYGDIPPEDADKVSKDVLEKLRKRMPGSSLVAVKKNGWLKSDMTFFQYPLWLGAGATLSPDAAYEVTKALYENDKDLHPIYVWLKGWQQQTMFDPAPPAPYHEGAVRFWKEKGLWTAEADAFQKQLLSR
ncbi:MAG: TAXI family TRAP transporter solute-binding subunit [Chloroflexi bacterium]|nr:TAXI family TRAP transporter solute-binding subunit [Chloroflexota bacterium]